MRDLTIHIPFSKLFAAGTLVVAELAFLLETLIFCTLAQVFDLVTSVGATPGSLLIESNPYARHADGSFWMWHGLLDKGLFLLMFLALGVAAYYCLRSSSKLVARIAATGPLLYYALGAVYAGVSNILLFSGLGRF